jgi:hypothetical protein
LLENSLLQHPYNPFPADVSATYGVIYQASLQPNTWPGDCRTEDQGSVSAFAAQGFLGQHIVCRATIRLVRECPPQFITGGKMKPMVILGALIVAAGLYILVNGASFTKDSTVLKAGPLEAHMEKKEPIPPWAGGIAVVVGIGFIAIGMRK